MGYPSDVKDKEWEQIKAFFDRPDPRGKRAKYDVHLVVNAIFYITKTGCHWRYLPRDFPPWWVVYKRFERWNKRGVWERVLDALTRRSRVRQAREACPSYALIDSQSVKTVYASEERGIDGGKKSKGQKAANRHRHAGESARGVGTCR